MTTNTILIIEDEPKLARLLADYLKQAEFETVCIDNGNDVIDAVKNLKPAAILLDIMLPGRDGIGLCRDIRTFSSVPILIVTARVEEIDRLLGLELGADDYICKPFSPREVVSRVKAVLRRTQQVEAPINTDFFLDENRLEIQFDQSATALTAVEFQLMKRLASEPGRIFSREQLMSCMYNDHRIVSDRTIDSHIKKLRKKLSEHWPQHDFIHSVYGAGYRFDLAATTAQ
ncbi:MAG: two-component system response regulator BaeR [Verrucomicrobiaceae bacterium]|nr:two-component system response regulator BaeR [Verrucomicrobiaceae bacterium]